MTEIVLEAEQREFTGKRVKQLRNQGRLPAVLYGRSIDPIPVTLDYRDASKLLPAITSSQLVIVDVEGEKYHALIREKQRHPVLANFLHVDFMVVSMTEMLRESAIIELIGEAPAIKELSGVLVTGVDVLEVECLPQDLPDRIEVDISAIKEIGDALYVRDITPPPNVIFLTDPDEMIVQSSYAAAEVEEEEEVVEEEFEAEPEVIERGKKEEEAEEELEASDES
ncbi:MAG: 50S ribosomal protein L25 [Anaerolineales bacterium]|jgi:large subunit ribosomal protein L25